MQNCKNGHPMCWSGSVDGYMGGVFACDKCRNSMPCMFGRWHCMYCKIDICQSCAMRGMFCLSCHPLCWNNTNYGYEEGKYTCGLCKKPEKCIYGRWNCPMCRYDVCLECRAPPIFGPNPAAPMPGMPSAPTPGMPSAPTSGMPSAPMSGMPSAPMSGMPSAPMSGMPAPGGYCGTAVLNMGMPGMSAAMPGMSMTMGGMPAPMGMPGINMSVGSGGMPAAGNPGMPQVQNPAPVYSMPAPALPTEGPATPTLVVGAYEASATLNNDYIPRGVKELANGADLHIEEIEIYLSKDMSEITYMEITYEPLDPSAYLIEKYVKKHGDREKANHVQNCKFPEEDYVANITGRHDGTKITKLCIISNKGKALEIGKDVGMEFNLNVPSGKKVISIATYFTTHLKCIGGYYL